MVERGSPRRQCEMPAMEQAWVGCDRYNLGARSAGDSVFEWRLQTELQLSLSQKLTARRVPAGSQD